MTPDLPARLDAQARIATRLSRWIGPITLAITLLACVAAWRGVARDRQELHGPAPQRPGPAYASPLASFWHGKPAADPVPTGDVPEIRGPVAGGEGPSPGRVLRDASRDLARRAEAMGVDLAENAILPEELELADACASLREPPCDELTERVEAGYRALGLPSPVPR